MGWEVKKKSGRKWARRGMRKGQNERRKGGKQEKVTETLLPPQLSNYFVKLTVLTIKETLMFFSFSTMTIASIKAVYVELPTQLYLSAHAKELSKYLNYFIALQGWK